MELEEAILNLEIERKLKQKFILYRNLTKSDIKPSQAQAAAQLLPLLPEEKKDELLKGFKKARSQKVNSLARKLINGTLIIPPDSLYDIEIRMLYVVRQILQHNKLNHKRHDDYLSVFFTAALERYDFDVDGLYDKIRSSIWQSSPRFSVAANILKSELEQGLDETLQCSSILSEQYQAVKRLSRGGVKETYLGLHQMDLTKDFKDIDWEWIVLKIWMPTSKGNDILESRYQQIEDAVQSEFEIRAQRIIQNGNPNINPLLHAYKNEEDDTHVTVEPYCNKGSLIDVIEQNPKIPVDTAIDYISQIINGWIGLTQLGYQGHSDLKPQNILVHQTRSNNVLKITDFHSLILKKSKTLPYIQSGYPATIAPELLGKEDVPKSKHDLFSIGAIGYFLATGEYLAKLRIGGKNHDFRECAGWANMPMQERIEKYDLPIRSYYSWLGQQGIDKELSRLPLEIRETLSPMLQMDYKARKLPSS